MLKCKFCQNNLSEQRLNYNVFYSCTHCLSNRDELKLKPSRYAINIRDSVIVSEIFRTDEYTIIYNIYNNEIINTQIGVDARRPEDDRLLYIEDKIMINSYINFDFSNENLINKKIKTLILFQ